MASRIAPARALAAMLSLRAGTHGLFAVWLTTRHPGWSEIFRTGAAFAIVDGMLGLVAAAFVAPLARRGAPRLLAVITLVDAMGRIALGIALRIFPGVVEIPMTATSLFGAVGLSAAGLGMVAMFAWSCARIRGGHSRSIDEDELFDPIAVAALMSFGVGLTLFLQPPATASAMRLLAIGASAGLAVVFAVASLGAFNRRPALALGR